MNNLAVICSLICSINGFRTVPIPNEISFKGLSETRPFGGKFSYFLGPVLPNKKPSITAPATSPIKESAVSTSNTAYTKRTLLVPVSETFFIPSYIQPPAAFSGTSSDNSPNPLTETLGGPANILQAGPVAEYIFNFPRPNNPGQDYQINDVQLSTPLRDDANELESAARINGFHVNQQKRKQKFQLYQQPSENHSSSPSILKVDGSHLLAIPYWSLSGGTGSHAENSEFDGRTWFIGAGSQGEHSNGIGGHTENILAENASGHTGSIKSTTGSPEDSTDKVVAAGSQVENTEAPHSYAGEQIESTDALNSSHPESSNVDRVESADAGSSLDHSNSTTERDDIRSENTQATVGHHENLEPEDSGQMGSTKSPTGLAETTSSPIADGPVEITDSATTDAHVGAADEEPTPQLDGRLDGAIFGSSKRVTVIGQFLDKKGRWCVAERIQIQLDIFSRYTCEGDLFQTDESEGVPANGAGAAHAYSEDEAISAALANDSWLPADE